MTKALLDDNLVVTDRGGVIENTHQVHAAVTDATGKILFRIGNPSRVTLIRSAAKPPQALAVLETGAYDKYGLEDEDLALMCASHNSERRHVERTRRMLCKAGAEESDLRCGGHPSIDLQINRAWIKDDLTPTAVYNNCSGKHAGMIAGAKAIGVSQRDYHQQDHPIQDRVKRVVEEVAGLSPDEIQWGVDGCNMPAPAYPLRYLAKTFAYFAEAADLVEAGAESVSPRTQLSARIFNAMSRHPEQVAGERRFCTIFMEAFEGGLIGKVGADGCYGIGMRESEDTRRLGARGALGISVKIGDGNLDILYAAVSEILERFDIGTTEARSKLNSFHHRQLVNTMGVVTGKIAFPFVIHEEHI